MLYGHYELVRLERELRLRSARPLPPLDPLRSHSLCGSLPRPRMPRRRARPLMQAHEYLELEFAVDDRR